MILLVSQQFAVIILLERERERERERDRETITTPFCANIFLSILMVSSCHV